MICDIIIKALLNYCITRGQMYLEKTQNQACLTYIKGELGELEFYFSKIPLQQQKFLVVSVFF